MKYIVIALIAFLVLAGGVTVAYLAMGDGTEDPYGTKAYTPPPLAENPPMSGSAIDAIDQEVRENNKKNAK